jgi:uncharacterized membrane protein YesL
MRAFVVAWRTLVSIYNELFFMLGVSVLWWITGGIFVGLAALFAWPMLQIGGPVWLAPLVAIPAGPAMAGIANAGRRVARDLHVDRGFFWDGFRVYWKKALALNAISMGVLALLMLNLLFYLSQENAVVRILAFLFLYLIVFWLSVQFYIFPILVGMKEPSLFPAVRMAAAMAFGNPLFSLVLLVIAAALTFLSIVLAIMIIFAWPALMALLGEHSLILMLQRAGIKIEDGSVPPKG